MTGSSRFFLAVSQLGSHAVHLLQVQLPAVRFECSRGCGRVRCVSPAGAAPRRIGSPEMLPPLLVPLLWLWSRTGAAPSRTGQLDSVVSVTADTFQSNFVQNRGKSAPSGGVTSKINHLVSSTDARGAFTMMTMNVARFEPDHLILL